MRNDYKISRARDGRLIVRHSARARRSRWPAAVVLVLVIAAFSLIDYSSLLDRVSETATAWTSSTEAAGASAAVSSSRTVTFKIPVGAEASVAPSVMETETALDESSAATETSHESQAFVDDAQSDSTVAAITTETVATESVQLPRVTTGSEEIGTAQLERTVVEVKSGDSLYTIFNTLGLSQRDMLRVTKGDGKVLTRIHPGQALEFVVSDAGALQKLVYRVSEVDSIHFDRDGDSFVDQRVEEPYETRVVSSQGEIQSSLFLSGQSAGLTDFTIMSMVEIFGWDVDFALDIRTGDTFSVIYEELYKDGVKVKDGAILAAEFVNQGRQIRALRYTDDTGHSSYFGPDGSSMRKAFLRTPVPFSRISSHFNLKRKHPILNTIRAHKGVDYAAPRGTPIKATGDGKIAFMGTKGGYGKTIIIRHGSTYTTLYGHMNGYAKGMDTGKSVRQGQTIGYIGSTGLATGPHLHYEFRVRGVHRNPVKVELPKAAPISPEYKAHFVESTQSLVAQLDNLSRTQIASQIAAQ